MGTNFYWIVTGAATVPSAKLWRAEIAVDHNDPIVHIGKRSAAGPYCWDCGVTLAEDGPDQVHKGRDAWHAACPKCGQEPTKVDILKEGPLAVELSFAKPATQRPTGVRGCSSFTWAQQPSDVERVCERDPDKELIQDEYGRKYTGLQFLEMLVANCPLQFTDKLDMRFS